MHLLDEKSKESYRAVGVCQAVCVHVCSRSGMPSSSKLLLLFSTFSLCLNESHNSEVLMVLQTNG